MKLALLLTSIFFLSGCALPPKKVTLKNKFNLEETKLAILSDGTNTVKGSALLRLNNGNIVTCAGRPIEIFPATAYARERIQAIHGPSEQGFKPSGLAYQAFIFDIDPPEYYKLNRATTCDAQGFFKFEKLPNGSFFIFTAIEWQIGPYEKTGGYLTQKVTVLNGETKEVVLSQ